MSMRSDSIQRFRFECRNDLTDPIQQTLSALWAQLVAVSRRSMLADAFSGGATVAVWKEHAPKCVFFTPKKASRQAVESEDFRAQLAAVPGRSSSRSRSRSRSSCCVESREAKIESEYFIATCGNNGAEARASNNGNPIKEWFAEKLV